jgi:hypothetical protein
VEFQVQEIRAETATDAGGLGHSEKLLSHRKRK